MYLKIVKEINISNKEINFYLIEFYNLRLILRIIIDNPEVRYNLGPIFRWVSRLNPPINPLGSFKQTTSEN